MSSASGAECVGGSADAAALPRSSPATSPPPVSPAPLGKNGGRKAKKAERAFHFDRHPSRKIALRLAYHGHVHDGLAKQKETSNTVEGLVCDALRRLRLVPDDGPHHFGRCGRTDKGVSALGNAFSFTARASCAADATPQLPPLDYCNMLNNVLPATIRIVGCALVDDAFDARFSCVYRTYRYYFCHRGLNVAAMAEAAAHLRGTHNFRNFCKMDVVNVSNFTRTVLAAGLHPSEQLPGLISYLEITANSFLYHQIRCTMEVLFLVGRGMEEPSVVPALLERGDCKPTYPLADGTPLVLWDCGFDNMRWHISRRAFEAAEQELQDISTALLVRATSADAMRAQLFRWYAGSVDVFDKTDAEGAGGGGGDGGESAATIASPVVRRGPDARRVDGWSITGCDWTDPGTAGQVKARRRDLLLYLRSDSGVSEGSEAPPPATDLAGPSRAPAHYVPLLQRETERTYEEEVSELSDKKRARYDVNETKKAVGAASFAAAAAAAASSVAAQPPTDMADEA
ncbi:pseudouridine synthase A-like protein [Novymonas esmeraldas]|uniref:Pseudouridine synthase A-like protein n=1 Tax=Novymonas esmeraldas TaxID=1808958 RepID=A0AAW0EM78_9TRYP